MRDDIITAHDVLTSCGTYLERLLYNQCTDEVKANAKELARRVSGLLFDWLQRCISSGFRDQKSNMLAGGSENSLHMVAAALDLFSLAHYLMKDYDGNKEKSLLVKWDLYLEHPDYTKQWCHLQMFPPKSGRRVFIP